MYVYHVTRHAPCSGDVDVDKEKVSGVDLGSCLKRGKMLLEGVVDLHLGSGNDILTPRGTRTLLLNIITWRLVSCSKRLSAKGTAREGELAVMNDDTSRAAHAPLYAFLAPACDETYEEETGRVTLPYLVNDHHGWGGKALCCGQCCVEGVECRDARLLGSLDKRRKLAASLVRKGAKCHGEVLRVIRNAVCRC